VIYVSIFWTAKYEKKSCLDWIVSLQVLSRSQLIFPSKAWFFGNLFEFSVAEVTYLKINISHILNQKSYQINSIKSCSSRSFEQRKRHFPIPSNIFSYDLNYISMTKSFNIQELLHHKPKCHGTKPIMHSPHRELSRDTNKKLTRSLHNNITIMWRLFKCYCPLVDLPEGCWWMIWF